MTSASVTKAQGVPSGSDEHSCPTQADVESAAVHTRPAAQGAPAQSPGEPSGPQPPFTHARPCEHVSRQSPQLFASLANDWELRHTPTQQVPVCPSGNAQFSPSFLAFQDS